MQNRVLCDDKGYCNLIRNVVLLLKAKSQGQGHQFLASSFFSSCVSFGLKHPIFSAQHELDPDFCGRTQTKCQDLRLWCNPTGHLGGTPVQTPRPKVILKRVGVTNSAAAARSTEPVELLSSGL